MELSRKQFDILSTLATTKEKLSQRQLSEKCGVSLGTINKVMLELVNAGYVADGEITYSGFDALEPYRAKRAIFIAAGFGTRLVPVTLNTPKPLVRVNGKRIIDTLIDACLEAGISEIYIVRGYLAEQFDQLLYKYPMIKFLENPSYNESNNISSAMAARYLLQNAYVFEADLFLRNPKVIKKYNYSSFYLGITVDRSDDWCFTVKDGFIDTWRVGGVNCYQEVGISYWTEADGHKLAGHIKECYEMPGGKERYWDDAALSEFKKQYHIGICECKADDIVEIDTLNELKKLDKSYDV